MKLGYLVASSTFYMKDILHLWKILKQSVNREVLSGQVREGGNIEGKVEQGKNTAYVKHL